MPLALRLAKEEGCLVGVSCMPEFDHKGSAPLLRQCGYTFNEAAICLGQAVAALRSQAVHGATAPLTLVLHDWGVAPGVIWCNRCVLGGGVAAPASMVLFDVLPPVEAGSVPADSLYELMVHLNYRALFASSFLLSRIRCVFSYTFRAK